MAEGKLFWPSIWLAIALLGSYLLWRGGVFNPFEQALPMITEKIHIVSAIDPNNGECDVRLARRRWNRKRNNRSETQTYV